MAVAGKIHLPDDLIIAERTELETRSFGLGEDAAGAICPRPSDRFKLA